MAHKIAIIASAGINLSILSECSRVIAKYPITKIEIIIVSMNFLFFFKYNLITN